MKTFSAKANEVDRKWWIIDARDQVLGRVAVKAANLLRGKEKAIVTFLGAALLLKRIQE